MARKDSEVSLIVLRERVAKGRKVFREGKVIVPCHSLQPKAARQEEDRHTHSGRDTHTQCTQSVTQKLCTVRGAPSSHPRLNTQTDRSLDI
eukprot:scaffold14720_cov172-Ochromonas_danica.AAC.4